jgi:hypothetical protein
MMSDTPKNLGEVILKLANGDEKTYTIPHDVAVDIQATLGKAIEEAIDKLRNRERSCPHADPFIYCGQCKVSPCPLGLNHE